MSLWFYESDSKRLRLASSCIIFLYKVVDLGPKSFAEDTPSRDVVPTLRSKSVLLSSWWEENLQEDDSMYFVLQVLRIRLAPFTQYWSLSTLPCTQVMQDVSLSGFDAWYTRLYHQHIDGKYNQVSLADQQYIC